MKIIKQILQCIGATFIVIFLCIIDILFTISVNIYYLCKGNLTFKQSLKEFWFELKTLGEDVITMYIDIFKSK